MPNIGMPDIEMPKIELDEIESDEQLDPASSATARLDVQVCVDPSVTAAVNVSLIRRAARAAANHQRFHSGQLGVRITDDATIQAINVKHLGHDYPTDVISFGYAADASGIEGELVASIDTAATRADELGWTTDNELVLYVVHGVLHIAGLDDHDPADRSAMRQAESDVMTTLGISEISRFRVDRDG